MYAPIGLSLFLRESSAQSSNRLGPLGRALSDDVLGAIVATARVIGALVLLFFLPGFLLINALYPRKGELDREYDALYRVTLWIVLSIAVTVFWSFFSTRSALTRPRASATSWGPTSPED